MIHLLGEGINHLLLLLVTEKQLATEVIISCQQAYVIPCTPSFTLLEKQLEKQKLEQLEDKKNQKMIHPLTTSTLDP
jgi:hypothetical protein